MRSVILLRSRPGRPWWQLTTRPSTGLVLGLVAVAVAVAQVALLSSPAPWYQLGVAGFWTVVGVAFLASAVGTRARTRREAAARARRPVVAEPFVPVPVVPARRRVATVSRAGSTGDGAGADRDSEPAREADTGEPTADLADAVRTAVNPVVTAVVPAAVGGTAFGPALAARLAAPSLPTTPAGTGAPPGGAADRPEVAAGAAADPGEPTTRLPREPGPATTAGTRNRHAVRAVLSAEFATRALEEESARQAAGRTPLRDGRVRTADSTVPRPRDILDEAASSAPTSHTRTTRSRGSIPRTSDPRTSSTGETRTSHRRTRKTRGAASPVPAAPSPTGEAPVPATAETPTPARGTTDPPAPPSLPSVASRPPAARPTSALTFGSAATADPAPTRRHEPQTPAPRDPSSADRPTRARPVDAGRHARAEAADEAAEAARDELRSARHAATNARR